MSPDGFVVFLRTADLDRADGFWRGSLGLPLALDQGTCRIYRIGPGAHLGVCEGEPVPDGVIVTLVADRVEEWCQRLAADGVVFERPPSYDPRFDITHAFLRDPDGHLVEIQRFEAAAWDQQ